MRSFNEVAGVLAKCWNSVGSLELNNWQLRCLSAIKDCRTLALGGHVDQCDSCGHVQISYNSCRNRHCPKCQGHKRVEWLEARATELLSVPYFHVVFTLPDILNPLAMYSPRIVYDTLFKSAWQTIEAFTGIDKKAGMVCILHTWGQNLSLHPHLHCIIPGGFVGNDGTWKDAKHKGTFLFPVKAMSKVYRAKYVANLRASDLKVDKAVYDSLFKKEWVVFTKRPFGTPKTVLEYMARYTHRVAISNRRILKIDAQTVTYTYKDYAADGKTKTMTLTHLEFVRRFALHILPKRFVRIRHYGFLSSTWKRSKLGAIQEAVNGKTEVKKETPEAESSKLMRCPCCKKGRMLILLAFDTRGPPEAYQHLLGQKQKSLELQ